MEDAHGASDAKRTHTIAPRISDLPDEMAAEVLAWLDEERDRAAVRATCKWLAGVVDGALCSSLHVKHALGSLLASDSDVDAYGGNWRALGLASNALNVFRAKRTRDHAAIVRRTARAEKALVAARSTAAALRPLVELGAMKIGANSLERDTIRLIYAFARRTTLLCRCDRTAPCLTCNAASRAAWQTSAALCTSKEAIEASILAGLLDACTAVLEDGARIAPRDADGAFSCLATACEPRPHLLAVGAIADHASVILRNACDWLCPARMGSVFPLQAAVRFAATTAPLGGTRIWARMLCISGVFNRAPLDSTISAMCIRAMINEFTLNGDWHGDELLTTCVVPRLVEAARMNDNALDVLRMLAGRVGEKSVDVMLQHGALDVLANSSSNGDAVCGLAWTIAECRTESVARMIELRIVARAMDRITVYDRDSQRALPTNIVRLFRCAAYAWRTLDDVTACNGWRAAAELLRFAFDSRGKATSIGTARHLIDILTALGRVSLGSAASSKRSRRKFRRLIETTDAQALLTYHAESRDSPVKQNAQSLLRGEW